MSRRCHAALLAFLLAAAPSFAATGSEVIYPGASAAAAAAARDSSGPGAITIFGALALAAAGGWLVWRGRKGGLAGRDARLLAITETKSLGSRQYLVVASYEGKKFLLGVCPGRIDLLTALDGREKSS